MARMQPVQQDVDGPANTNLANAAETVIATLTGVSTSGNSTQVVLEGSAQITPGATASGLVLRVRRVGLAGAQVGPASNVPCAATVPNTVAIQVDDFPGEVAGLTYVLTVVQTAATGAGTATSANLSATSIG